MQTVGNMSVGQSCLNAGTNHKRRSNDNYCHLSLGLISINLPQHPASLHDVVSRGTRQLSFHMSEFVTTPTPKP